MSRSLLVLVTLALALGLSGLYLLVEVEDPAWVGRPSQRERAAPEVEGERADLAEVARRDGSVDRHGDPVGAAPNPGDAQPAQRARREVADASGYGIRFELQDDLGQPIEAASFELRAGDGPSSSRLLASEDGRFHLTQLAPGPWSISATVAEHTQQGDEREHLYQVRHGGPQIRLVFDRNGSVSGRVVDAAGAGVPQIEVELRAVRAQRGWSQRESADENGGFAFESVPPGPVVAKVSNGVVEETLGLELSPGELVEGVEIRVASGGYVQGRVLDRESRPAPGMAVIVVDRLDFRSSGETDETGAFRIGPITPGHYELFAILKEDERDDDFRQLLTCEVTVIEGAVVEVLLQREQDAPVRLHGLVTLAGEPLPRCVVYAFREDAGLLETVRMSHADDEGAYEVELDRPGPFLMLFEPRDNPSNSPIAPLRILVPEVSEHRLDLALPVGSIAGRVSDLEDEGYAGVRVFAKREDGYLDFELPDTNRGVRTDKNGTFVIRYLSPASYTLRVEGGQLAWPTREGVVVGEGEAVSGVELRAGEGGGVRGVVRAPDGTPLRGAAVYLRDDGARLVRAQPAVTDADGAFEIAGVPVGRVSACARAPGLAAGESPAKELESGEWISFELQLEPGSLLTVRAVDGSGRPVSSALRVRDSAGRDVTHTASQERSAGNFADPLSTNRRTVGPLPPGRYQVTATRPDGRRVERDVRLSAGTDRELKLRFD